MVVSRDGDAAEGVSPISELQECEHAIIASDSVSYLAATTHPPVTRTSSLEELTLLNHRARGYVDCGSTFVTVPEHGENAGPVIYFLMYEVPEPATSTLSQLAVSSCAARRRRTRCEVA